MRLNFLLRRAVTLVRGIEIKQVFAMINRDNSIQAMCIHQQREQGCRCAVVLAHPYRGNADVQDDKEFEMAVFSVVPWFKVIERYPLSGEERRFKRRDLRRGPQLAAAGFFAAVEVTTNRIPTSRHRAAGVGS